MTRENAILCLKGIKNYGRDTFTEQSDWQESLDMAIKALEQEPTTKNDLGVDCISRQAVLDLINADWKYENLEIEINNLPSVPPQEPRWISVSERLPEEDGEYYATIYDTDEDYLYMDIAELEDGIWQYKDYIKVLAWMPLPKPYEPQGSEDA